MELPQRGTDRGCGMCSRRKARVAAPASSRVTVEAVICGSRPLLVCIETTTSSISARASAGCRTTRSGPSATRLRSSSVTRVAISTITWRTGSSPVISRSIQASTPGILGRAYHPAVLELPVMKLDPDLPLPSYAREGDAGLDLVAREDTVLGPGGGRALVPTGVAVAIPEGHAGFIQPRSGLALKHGVTCLNTPGLIDSGYRGELKVLLINTDPAEAFTVTRGEPIAQLVVQQVEHVAFEVVDELPSDSERGDGGFGHTGR